MSGFDQYYDEAVEPGKRERAYAWAGKVHNAAEIATRICEEYGVKNVGAVAGLHRRSGDVVRTDVVDVGVDVGVNVGVNVGVKRLNPTEENAVKSILQNSHINATDLAKILVVSKRQAERVIAALKKKAGLKRRGADKNGEWYFEPRET